MGLRFRKSKKVGPFRVNISQKGVGWSVGVPGLRYTKKAGGGSRVTASVPGTGLSYVKESSSNQRKTPWIPEGNTVKLNAAKSSAPSMPVPSPELTEPRPPQNGGKKPGHGCLWWVMAILFWPFFLSAWFWKTDRFKLKKPARAFALVAVWAILLAAGSASPSAETNLTASSPAVSSASVLAAESEPESRAVSSEPVEPAETAADSQPEEQTVPAIDFSLQDQFGNTHTLADYEGKTILLNFWATWCGPCQQEMPDLQALYEEWGENEGDLVVLGVAAPKADDSLYPADNKSAEEIAAWLDEQGYTYPVLMDTTGELFLSYGVYSFPTTFMIDTDGNVFGYLSGSMTREIMDSIVEQTMTGERVAG